MPEDGGATATDRSDVRRPLIVARLVSERYLDTEEMALLAQPNQSFPGPRRRPAMVALATILLGSLLAACGSSSGGGNSTSAPTSGASASGSTGSVPSSVATAVAAAKKAVLALSTRPTSLVVPALPSRPAPGKTVDFIACGVPSCQAYIPILEQATAAVGWHLVAIDSGLTAASVGAAYDQAVRNRPSGGVIGSGGDSPSLFSHQLAELKAEGVPVILQVVPPTNNPAVTAVVYSQRAETQFGTEMADEILAHSDGQNVHLAIVTTPQTPVFAYEHPPLVKAMSPASCDSCSVSTFSFPETDLGTTLPSEVVSYVRSHPNINYLFFDFSGEVDGVPAALHVAGLSSKITIVTNDSTATETAYIKAGQELAAAGNAWPELCWKEIDILLSKSENISLTPSRSIQLPTMILTKATIPTSSSFYFPLVVNYQSFFKKAWHV